MILSTGSIAINSGRASDSLFVSPLGKMRGNDLKRWWSFAARKCQDVHYMAHTSRGIQIICRKYGIIKERRRYSCLLNKPKSRERRNITIFDVANVTDCSSMTTKFCKHFITWTIRNYVMASLRGSAMMSELINGRPPPAWQCLVVDSPSSLR